MSFVSYWVEKETGYKLQLWEDIINAIYLGYQKSNFCTILFEVDEEEIVETLLQSVGNQELGDSGILSKYVTDWKEKSSRQRSVLSCIQNFKRLGHRVTWKPNEDEFKLTVDDNVAYHCDEDGTWIKIEISD